MTKREADRVRPLTEGMVVKGGRNHGPSQIGERPPAPGPINPRPTPEADRFKRYYAVEIDFDTPIDFAEQDRLACVVLERLVNEFWSDAAAGTKQGNLPITVVAYRIEKPPR